MFVKNYKYSTIELTTFFGVSKRTVYRYIDELNDILQDSFINSRIVYDRSIKKYVIK